MLHEEAAAICNARWLHVYMVRCEAALRDTLEAVAPQQALREVVWLLALLLLAVLITAVKVAVAC